MSPYRTGNFITAADVLLKVFYLLKRYDFNATSNEKIEKEIRNTENVEQRSSIKSTSTVFKQSI